MERGPHTKIKLKLVGSYLTACADVHRKEPSHFTYFETHAGDGLTIINGEEIPGSVVIAVNRDVQVAAMDKDLNRVTALTERLGDRRNVVAVFQGDVTNSEDVRRLLGHVPRYYHSLGFLDPEGPGQLPFSAVEQILNHTYFYKNDSSKVRRPELLITFPLKRSLPL